MWGLWLIGFWLWVEGSCGGVGSVVFFLGLFLYVWSYVVGVCSGW